MNPSHHPSEAWLLDFALGNLVPGFETVINAHIGTCAECRDNVKLAESFGGELLAHMGGEPSPQALSSLEISEPAASLNITPASRAVETVAPESFEHFVQTYLHSSINALRWRSIGKGLQICQLSNEQNVRLWMLKAQPGTVLPEHAHPGSELTMVLKGAYFCGSEIFRAGDIEDADEETTHRPMVTRDGECICLAVTEGNLQFKSLLPRLVQPFFGI
ncbi:MAG: ChrR family anti-sigma-E factor [Gammaproteobacteria bacterium]